MNILLLTVLISIIFTLITLLLYRTVFTPNMLFNALWVMGLFLITEGYAGIYSVNEETYLHVIVALIAFNIAYFLFSKQKVLKIEKQDLSLLTNIDAIWGRILIINLTMVVFCFPYFLKMIFVWITESFYQVRVYAYSYANIYELLCSKVINLLMYAFFNILLIIAVLKLAQGEKCFKLYALVLFDICFFCIITGSRNYIAKPFVFFAVAFLFMKNISKKPIKIKMKVVILGLIFALVLHYAIKARSLRGLSPIENIVIYLFGGITYYDRIINSALFSKENAILLYGQGTLGWIVSPFLYVMSLLSILPDYTAESIIGRVSSQGIYISDTYNFNALTTALYPMWRDFGVVGIAIGMFVFAIFVAHYRNKLFKNFNQRNMLLYLSFVCAVSEVTQYYEPLFIRFGVQIAMILILWRQNNNFSLIPRQSLVKEKVRMQNE